jgi:hypothetical protein
MGTRRVNRDAEILAKGRKLEVRGWWLIPVLVEVPHGPLKGAKDLVPGRKVDPFPLVPCLEEWAIEGRVVGNKLG